jgi:hypothetical protein
MCTTCKVRNSQGVIGTYVASRVLTSDINYEAVEKKRTRREKRKSRRRRRRRTRNRRNGRRMWWRRR